MKLCRVTMLLLPLVFVSALTAQTKITGKQHCQTPRVIAREPNGTYVGNMDNGDKFYIEFHWATLKDGTPPETVKGYWAFTGGTGKLYGITGSGTYTATENENGGEVNMEGEYSVAVPARK